ATLGAAWTYWLLSPIGRLTRHARAVRMGGRAVVPELGHAELRTLSRALEAMRRELEGLDYVENYVQALTHELKSPLAGIRGAAELLDEDMPDDKRARFLENIRAETGRCEDLVRRLVQLAALESRTAPDRIEKLDFAALVRDEIATLRPRLEAKTLRLTEEFSAETDDAGTSKWIAGDPLTLQIAVRNLLTNAIDFSPDGGEIRVLLGRGEEDGGVELRIEDEGPGVPDYAAERIFDRFYSLKHSVTGRKGSGLGLCFVRQAMLLHGGDIRLENRGSGAGGTRAVMRLGS
ncbi:MAG: HAMP domain-containing protein, partial [Verrucomicrobiae bacterium]|nr:HAMP domain-containing protein [Verrucomicrobiae bacterium]